MKVAVTVDFMIQQDFIAENLCENRNKPEMHCNGKCVLMKKLNLTDNSDTPRQLPEILRFEISSFLISSLWEMDVLFSERSIFTGNFIDSFKPALFISDIFHPPRNYSPKPQQILFYNL